LGDSNNNNFYLDYKTCNLMKVSDIKSIFNSSYIGYSTNPTPATPDV